MPVTVTAKLKKSATYNIPYAKVRVFLTRTHWSPSFFGCKNFSWVLNVKPGSSGVEKRRAGRDLPNLHNIEAAVGPIPVRLDSPPDLQVMAQKFEVLARVSGNQHVPHAVYTQIVTVCKKITREMQLRPAFFFQRVIEVCSRDENEDHLSRSPVDITALKWFSSVMQSFPSPPPYRISKNNPMALGFTR